MPQPMNNYRLTGNYGTFVIQRTLRASQFAHAWQATGIVSTLADAGWDVMSGPDGEVWTIEVQLADGSWYVVTD